MPTIIRFVFLLCLYAIPIFSADEMPYANVLMFDYYGDHYYLAPDVNAPWIPGKEPPYVFYSPREGYILRNSPDAIHERIEKKDSSEERILEVTLDGKHFEVALIYAMDPNTKQKQLTGFRQDHIHEDGTRETISRSGEKDSEILSTPKEGLYFLFGRNIQVFDNPLDRIDTKNVSGSELCLKYDMKGPARVRLFTDLEDWSTEMAKIIHTPDEQYFYAGAEDLNYPRFVDSPPNPFIISELGGSQFTNLSNIEEEFGDLKERVQIPTIDWITGDKRETLKFSPGYISLNSYVYKAFFSDPIEHEGRRYEARWSRSNPRFLELKPLPTNPKEPRISRSYFYKIPANSQHPLWNQSISFWRKHFAE